MNSRIILYFKTTFASWITAFNQFMSQMFALCMQHYALCEGSLSAYYKLIALRLIHFVQARHKSRNPWPPPCVFFSVLFKIRQPLSYWYYTVAISFSFTFDLFIFKPTLANIIDTRRAPKVYRSKISNPYIHTVRLKFDHMLHKIYVSIFCFVKYLHTFYIWCMCFMISMIWLW